MYGCRPKTLNSNRIVNVYTYLRNFIQLNAEQKYICVYVSEKMYGFYL